MDIENREYIQELNTERYSCYGKSMIGGRQENQDYFKICIGENDRLIATVCDGMGGAAGGAIASQMSADAIIAYLSVSHSAVKGEEEVLNSIKAGNESVYKKALETPSLRGMGTTATVALFEKDAAYVAHAGDSRIYQLRNGKKRFRTFDHSFVFEKVKAGYMTEEQARMDSRSNIILRALGIRPNIEADVQKLAYKKGDRFVLCCDGIWNSMPETDLLEILCSEGTPETIVETLTNRTEEIGIKNGGQHDNMTIIIAEMKEDSAYQPSLFHKAIKTIMKKK